MNTSTVNLETQGYVNMELKNYPRRSHNASHNAFGPQGPPHNFHSALDKRATTPLDLTQSAAFYE